VSIEAERDLHVRRDTMATESRAEVESILTLAGLKPSRMWELTNGYWPLAPAYDDVRCPWWLAQTSIGLIRIGWRKRVLSIEWDATPHRHVVTSDDVTKGETMVHAYSAAKAVEYLTALRVAPTPPEEPGR
jgi:hypothetical protein